MGSITVTAPVGQHPAMYPARPRLPALAPRLPGNSPPVVERPSVKEHTEKEWAARKDLIEALYIGDNRKLNEIMAIMETKYGFAATEQMYKKRFKKWNIRKRAYRKSAVETKVSTPSSASAATPTSTSTSSSSADSKQEDDDVEEVPRTPETPAVTGLDLVPNPQFKPLADLELVLNGVMTWSSEKLESYRIASDPMSRYLATPNKPIQDSRTMYRTFELVFDLWSYGKGDLAGMAARKGFYVMEYVLTEDHPDLLWHMLDTIYDMIDRGHLQLLSMFIRHALVLARSRFPETHPLIRILQQLLSCDYQTEHGRQFICYLLRQAWLRNVDLLSEHIKRSSPQEFWLYEQLIWDGRTRLRRNNGLANRREIMYEGLESLGHHEEHLVSDGNDGNLEKLRVDALMLEFTQMDLDDKEKAEQMALDLLDTTQFWSGALSNARFHAYARKMLARICESKQDWDRVEENLKQAIHMREAAHGTTSNLRVIRDMWVLAAYYQKVGKIDDALQVAQDAITRAQQYLHDLPG
ncbi:Clr5 domain-containing protein [Trichoderma simmonsii]|uniref:Clr5 domain-containing protein n=1 Tax=Trichoderma simmonsii TaxID=1491479 RepID=A0A8G0LKR9_9HYPO|nr:Clr5 domain-containing protein [Trichoderma simmonsii]